MSEADAKQVNRWDRTVPWNGSTMTLRTIRDYLAHDFPDDPAEQETWARSCELRRYLPRHAREPYSGYTAQAGSWPG